MDEQLKDFAELRAALIRNAGFVPWFSKDDSGYVFRPSQRNDVETIARESAKLLDERDRLQGQVDRLIDKCVKPCEGGYFILVGENHGMYPNQAAAIATLLEKNK